MKNQTAGGLKIVLSGEFDPEPDKGDMSIAIVMTSSFLISETGKVPIVSPSIWKFPLLIPAIVGLIICKFIIHILIHD